MKRIKRFRINYFFIFYVAFHFESLKFYQFGILVDKFLLNRLKNFQKVMD